VSTPKLIAMMIAWVLASVMIAVVAAIVVTEILRAVGIVETGSASYDVSINAVFAVVFLAVVSVPVVFRRRFTSKEPYEP
jgi:hypothetical protein